MSDLISRQAAIDALGERPMVWVGSDYELGARNQYDADVLALETVPSAQPEQKTGRWLTHSDFPDRLICSECGVQFDMWHWESKQMHFCPHCGVRMGNTDEQED